MKVLVTSIALATAMSLSLSTRQDPAEFRVEQVTPRHWLIHGHGVNTVVYKGEGGCVVIDPKSRSLGASLSKRIDALGVGPVRYVIATSHRMDTVGGNSAFANATVIMHQTADRRTRDDGRDGANLNFESAITLRMGEEQITCRHKGPGFTDGDLFVYFHVDQVLVTGGLVVREVHPALGEPGCELRVWRTILGELRKEWKGADRTKIVPLLGPAGGLPVLTEMSDYLTDLLDLGDEAHRRGWTVDETIAASEPLRKKHVRGGADQWLRNVRAAYAETAQ